MEIVAAMGAKRLPLLTIQDLLSAKTRIRDLNLKVQETDDSASIQRVDASGKSDTLIYAFLVRCRDGRVKTIFSKPDNPYPDPSVISKEFDPVRSSAAALRVLMEDPRFFSKDRVETFVRSVGVSELSKSLPGIFSDFMSSVAHVFNRKTGNDVSDQIDKLRGIVRALGSNLSEADILRIYREEVVSAVHDL